MFGIFSATSFGVGNAELHEEDPQDYDIIMDQPHAPPISANLPHLAQSPGDTEEPPGVPLVR